MTDMRRRGDLHNLHVRIANDDYSQITMVCKKLNITIADYINAVLHRDGIEELLRIARRIETDPRPCEVTIDDTTRASINALASALTEQSTQLRKLGTNLSNLIKYIASHRVRTATPYVIQDVKAMKQAVDSSLAAVQRNASRLADILYDENAITKTEFVKANTWDDDGCYY